MPTPPASTATPQHSPTTEGLTLDAYAKAKRLPLPWLATEIGLSQAYYLGKPAVKIPYRDEAGHEVAVRFRLALDGKEKFRTRSGDSPTLYGLDRLAFIRQAGYVVVVEGESDSQTLWHHGLPALGLPGADSWREDRDAPQLDGLSTVYVVVEPDKGGEAVLKWLARSKIRGRARLLAFDGVKDPSALYLADPDKFRENFHAALGKAVPWSEYATRERGSKTREALAKCESLASQPNLLDLFAESLARSGVVGEARIAKIVYLAVTSRLFDRPVSVAIKGPSSAGKSYVAERVLTYFPASAFYALSAMSERALAYSEETLEHRFLVLFEAAGMSGDFASYLLRSLLSEGCVRYETVEKTKDGLKARMIERPGPTGLLVTTTAITLHPENETRLLSLTVTDSTAQTKAVLRALAQGERPPVDLAPWIALQEWIAAGETRVAVPFAPALAERVPAAAVRLRRDFCAILNLIRAHALLHRATRSTDSEGRVVATLDDYAAVRDLVAELVADSVGTTVPETVRETVKAVKDLAAAGTREPSVARVAKALKIDRSSASRRVDAALDRGFLRNEEDKKGKPARIVLADPIPDDAPILPSLEALAADCCSSAPVCGGVETPPPPLDPSPRDPVEDAERDAIQAEGTPTVADVGGERP